MKIKELFKRNLPVLAIGSLTIFVFLFIIFTSQLSGKKPATQLIELSNDDLIAPHTNFKGPASAPVTVVEFSDFECPACKIAHSIMEDLSEQYPDELKWAFRHFPLDQHKNAKISAIAAQAAGEQGKFWQYASVLFENQEKLSSQDHKNYADLINLDLEKFNADINNPSFKEIVEIDFDYGNKIGVNSTPTFYMNGKILKFESLDGLKSTIKAELDKARAETPKTVVNEASSDTILTVDSSLDTTTAAPNETSETTPEEVKPEDTTPAKPATQEETSVINVHKIIDDTFGILEINYTDTGFTPKNTKAVAGQIVKWTNKTDKEIRIKQIIDYFDELKEPKILKPGESYELRLRLRKTGIWTYKNTDQEVRSSILITKLHQDLLNMLPENSSL